MLLPGIIPDPLILDHSFPRSEEELAQAEKAVAALHDLVLNNESACLLITDTFLQLLELMEWSGTDQRSGKIKTEIYRYLQGLLMRQGKTVKVVSITARNENLKHPLPGASSTGPLVDYWQVDVGNLHSLHIEKIGSQYAVGVICSQALCGNDKSCYQQSAESFPLIATNELETLAPVFEYDCHSDILNQAVAFSAALKNIEVLGATVRNPSGSSHWVATFDQGRSWPIDRNTDPLPERFLKQLVGIVEKPYEYIHYVLIEGKIPGVKFRLDG